MKKLFASDGLITHLINTKEGMTYEKIGVGIRNLRCE